MTIDNIREALNGTYESWKIQAETFRKYNVNHDFFDEMFATMTFVGKLLIASNTYENGLFDELYAEAKEQKDKMNAIVKGEVDV